MKEKLLLKIILVLITIILILTFVSIIVYADDTFYEAVANYIDYENDKIRYVLPYEGITMNLSLADWESIGTSTYKFYYCSDSRATEYGYYAKEHKKKFLKNGNIEEILDTRDKSSKTSGFTFLRKNATSSKYTIVTYKLRLVNKSDRIAVFGFENEFFKNNTGVSLAGGYYSYEDALAALNLMPQISGSFLDTNTYLPYSANSVMFDVLGSNLPNGSLDISLYKIVDGNKTRVKTIDSFENELNELNERYTCGQLELGDYEVEIIYTYPDVETGLNKVAFETLNFTISNSSSQNGTYEVSLGNSIHTVDNYFNRIWVIENPIKNLTYNSVPSVRIKGNLEFLEKQGILQKWGYKNVDIIDEIDVSIPYGLGKLNSVWLNDYYLGEFNFENVESLNFNFNIPESKLNRGLNTIYITSYTGSDISRTYANFERNGSYHHLFSGIDFYYKTSDQPGPGGGGVGGDDPYNDGIDIGSPPNRANYQSGLYGDIQFALDYIVYLIKIPFKVIFGGLGWLVENFTNMFSWVGELTSMIGTWFGFLPSEIRLLILGVIVCTFVGFAISIFKK